MRILIEYQTTCDSKLLKSLDFLESESFFGLMTSCPEMIALMKSRIVYKHFLTFAPSPKVKKL
jgi:hypothetical protein